MNRVCRGFRSNFFLTAKERFFPSVLQRVANRSFSDARNFSSGRRFSRERRFSGSKSFLWGGIVALGTLASYVFGEEGGNISRNNPLIVYAEEKKESSDPYQLALSAIKAVDEQLTKEKAPYVLQISESGYMKEKYGYRDGKSPVFLQVKHENGEIEKIGCVHLVKLEGKNVKGKDWDMLPYESIKASREEVIEAIKIRLSLYWEAKKNPRLHIDPKRGTIYDFRKVDVILLEDGTFKINENVVRNDKDGQPIQLFWLITEGILRFIPQPNGHVKVTDGVDKREGKGMFIDLMGRLYRADTPRE